MTDSQPETVAEISRVAGMIRSGSDQAVAMERAPGIRENQGIGSSYLLTTAAGNVLINTGVLKDARRGRELFASVSAEPKYRKSKQHTVKKILS